MRTPPRFPTILSALILALILPASAPRAQEQEPAPSKPKVQKRHVTPNTAAQKSQTQTAPAAQGGKGKPQTRPAGEAGFRDVQGTVLQVFPERHAIVIRTSTNDHQVFVTPETLLVRDGVPADLKQILPGDRVESCQFNAKNAIKRMTVLGTGKPLVQQPTATPPKP